MNKIKKILGCIISIFNFLVNLDNFDQHSKKMLNLGVRIFDLTVVLNTLHGVSAKLPLSPKN